MQITLNLVGICRGSLLLGLIIVCISATAVPRDLVATISAGLDDNDKGIDQSYCGFIFNMTTVLRILRKLNYLNVYLSQTLELSNNLVRFLLEQKVCPLQIFIGVTMRHTISADVKRFMLKFYVPPTNRMVTTKADELETTLKRFASKEGYLLCVIFGELDESELRQIAEQLWKSRGIYRIYYFTRASSWFYHPFSRANDDQGFGALVDANKFCMECIFVNMNGYIVRTYIFDSVFSSVFGDPKTKTITKVRGADSEAGMLLSKKLNFTMALQWPDDEFFGARLENGSYNGAIGRLIRGETDITLSGFFVKDYLTREITFTISIYMDELCCYVMKARRVPQSILPLFAVRVDIWVGFFLVGLLSPLIWMLIRYLNLFFGKDTIHTTAHIVEATCSTYPLHSNFQYARIFTDTWVIWVRSTITRFPPFYSERIFVASLCLVSVIYGALFESSLATVYIRPLYYKDINTLQELDDAGFRIYIKHPAMKDDLFYGHSSQVYQHLNRKLLLVAETEERLISMMSKRGGFTAVTRASSLVLDDIRYFITNKIHKIPECPKNYHIAFVLPRQSPFEEPFNAQLLFFLQAGLIQQWIDSMKHKAKTKIHTYPDYKAERDNHWKVLTLKDLQLAFYTLGVGCTLAFVSLIGEFILRLKLNFCCCTTPFRNLRNA